jgi:hypothetical protein
MHTHTRARARVSARRRACALRCACSLTAAAGCSDSDRAPELGVALQAAVLGAEEASALPVVCGSVLTKGPSVWFENLEVSATPYTCWRGGGSAAQETFLVDDLGRRADVASLKRLDAIAFRDRHHRIDADLRALLEKRAAAEMVPADVWFAMPPDAEWPPKDEMLALSATEREAVTSAVRAAFKKRADALAAEIATIPGHARLVRSLGGMSQTTPVLTVQADTRTLERIGDLDGVVAIGDALEDDRESSEVFYDLDEIPYMVDPVRGYDGTGVTVADITGTSGVYDSAELALAAGSCTPPSGPSYLCYCSASAPNGAPGSHTARVLGLVKNRTAGLRGGTATNARTIPGMTGPGATIRRRARVSRRRRCRVWQRR